MMKTEFSRPCGMFVLVLFIATTALGVDSSTVGVVSPSNNKKRHVGIGGSLPSSRKKNDHKNTETRAASSNSTRYKSHHYRHLHTEEGGDTIQGAGGDSPHESQELRHNVRVNEGRRQPRLWRRLTTSRAATETTTEATTGETATLSTTNKRQRQRRKRLPRTAVSTKSSSMTRRRKAATKKESLRSHAIAQKHEDDDEIEVILQQHHDEEQPHSLDRTVIRREKPAKRKQTRASHRTRKGKAKSSRGLELAICSTYVCNSVAFTLPIVLLPMIATEYEQAVAGGAVGASSAAGAGGSMATAARFVASVASISNVGGGLGQFLNGFVCQRLGGRNSSVLYMLGNAFGCFLLSTTSMKTAATKTTGMTPLLFVGLAVAGLEFCAAVQWTACSVILTNHLASNDPARLAHAITLMSLSSTGGCLLGKALGPLLLHSLSWRRVSQLGGLVALVGALIMQQSVMEHPHNLLEVEEEDEEIDQVYEEASISPKTSRKHDDAKDYDRDAISESRSAAHVQPSSSSSSSSLDAMFHSMRTVMGSSVFWISGISYATSFLCRTSEKVLGSFVQQITGLPSSICGGLTISITLGFVLGLLSSSSFHSLPTIAQKKELLRRRYHGAVVSSLVLALIAHQPFRNFLNGFALLLLRMRYGDAASSTPWIVVGVVVVASGMMASSLAFQFYQLPNLVANSFGGSRGDPQVGDLGGSSSHHQSQSNEQQHTAICLSFLDGVGFLAAAPIWALLGRIVSWDRLKVATVASTKKTTSTARPSHHYGWSVAWLLVAGIYALGGRLMMTVFHTVMERQPMAASVTVLASGDDDDDNSNDGDDSVVDD